LSLQLLPFVAILSLRLSLLVLQQGSSLLPLLSSSRVLMNVKVMQAQRPLCSTTSAGRERERATIGRSCVARGPHPPAQTAPERIAAARRRQPASERASEVCCDALRFCFQKSLFVYYSALLSD